MTSQSLSNFRRGLRDAQTSGSVKFDSKCNRTQVFMEEVLYNIYWTNVAKKVSVCPNTSQVIQVKMHLLQHLSVLL